MEKTTTSVKIKGNKYNLRDVKSLGWNNTKDLVEIFFYENIKPETIFKSNKEENDLFLKIKKISMKSRLERYQKILSNYGGINYYHQFSFYSNGIIFRNDSWFHIDDISINEWRLNFPRKDYLSKPDYVDLYYDSDVIHWLLYAIIARNPVNPIELVKIREKQIEKENFILKYIEIFSNLFGKIAYADGILSNEEIDNAVNYIEQKFQLNQNQLVYTKNTIINSNQDELSFEYYANQIKYKKILEPQDLVELADMLVKTVLSVDDNLSAEEELMINQFLIIFNVRSKVLENYYQSRKENQKFHSKSTESDFEKILGVNNTSSFEEIQKAYRKLSTKYHPDKFSHLGEDFQKLAENKMKEINSAYEYFKKNY